MAVLGHPFFAGGHDVAHDDDEFMALRALLARTTSASSWPATRTTSSTTRST